MAMRSLLGAFALIGTAAVAAGQTSAPQPPAGRSASAAADIAASGRDAADAGRAAGARAGDASSHRRLLGRVVRGGAGDHLQRHQARQGRRLRDGDRQAAGGAARRRRIPVRNQQGWGWKIFKAAEPGPNGSVLYVFVMDPAVKGADYGVAKILARGVPDRDHGVCIECTAAPSRRPVRHS